MIILVKRYGKSGVDSRTTAIVNQSGLRLTPWNQDSFQRDFTNCFQDNSFTSVVPASTEYQLQRRRSLMKSISKEMPVLHRSHRHQRSSSEHESPRRADPVLRATTAVQQRARADGWTLRGRPTPSAQESVEEGCGQTHPVDGKTTTTVHVRQQPLAHPGKPRAKELAL